MQTALIIIHAYLFAISLWYAILSNRYLNNLPIPKDIQDAFDKEDGEAVCFAYGIVFLLVAAGFVIEIILSPMSRPLSRMVPFVLGALFFALTATVFFMGWYNTARNNARSTPSA